MSYCTEMDVVDYERNDEVRFGFSSDDDFASFATPIRDGKVANLSRGGGDADDEIAC